MGVQYHLGLDDLVENRGLTAAKQRSWRYFVKHNEEIVASADAIIDDDGNPMFSHTNEGPLVDGFISAIDVAYSFEMLEGEEHEVRILMVPALYVAVLWLVDLKGDQDYFMELKELQTSGFLQEYYIIKTTDVKAAKKLILNEDLLKFLAKTREETLWLSLRKDIKDVGMQFESIFEYNEEQIENTVEMFVHIIETIPYKRK